MSGFNVISAECFSNDWIKCCCLNQLYLLHANLALVSACSLTIDCLSFTYCFGFVSYNITTEVDFTAITKTGCNCITKLIFGVIGW